MTPPPAIPRRVRVTHFNCWAEQLEDAAAYLQRLPAFDVIKRVSNPHDARLVRMARLDCDWHGENMRVFNALAHPSIEFLPARIVGLKGLAEIFAKPPPLDEEHWFILMGQHPQAFAHVAPKFFSGLTLAGIRVLFYAFDEASRAMPCFPIVAPHLRVLIHDESPLAPTARSLLPPGCLTVHRSWVANLLPFAEPFCETPEQKIVFLGSELGYTPHRKRQVEFLQKKFKDRFVAIHDHSLPVAARGSLTRFHASLCPEGRKFTTPAMSATHTDRPFWSGCLGLVPISEDSRTGGRLESLHREGLIVRYPHGNLAALAEACERALATPLAERRRLYDYFNRHETVGAVVAEAIAACPPSA